MNGRFSVRKACSLRRQDTEVRCILSLDVVDVVHPHEVEGKGYGEIVEYLIGCVNADIIGVPMFPCRRLSLFCIICHLCLIDTPVRRISECAFGIFNGNRCKLVTIAEGTVAYARDS